MLDLSTIKSDFSSLVLDAQPWTLTQFVMWLDLKLSEYKIKGYMVLDHQKTTKPRWLSGPDDDERGSEVVPQPPSCPTCHTNQTRADYSSRRRDNYHRQSNKRPRESHDGSLTLQSARQGSESYISEVLSVGDNIQSSQTSFDSRDKKDPVGTIISLEPATDLTVEDIEEMDQVMNSNSQRINDDSRLRQRDSRVPTHHTMRASSSTLSSDITYITAGSNQDRHSTSVSKQPPRVDSPPKRQVAMVDLSQTEVPVPDISLEPSPPSRQEFTSATSADTGYVHKNSPVSTPVANESTKTSPVPVALHANIEVSRNRSQDPGGTTNVPMETGSSIIPTSDIKQETEAYLSFDNSMYTGTDDSMSQMYLVGDNSLSDSEASYSQNPAYSPGQSASQSGQVMTMGSGLYSVGEQEVDLPKFEDPLVRRVLEDGGTPSRNMWSRIITKCAYHMLSKGVPHKHDYQMFSKAFYLRYPCIGTNRGPNPWSFFTKSLSRSIRNIRYSNKKKMMTQNSALSTTAIVKQQATQLSASLSQKVRNMRRRPILSESWHLKNTA